MQFFIISLVSLVFLCLVMIVAWVVQRATHNAGWVDMIWTFGSGAAGVIAALAPGVVSNAFTAREVLAAVLVTIWSLRLGIYILSRNLKIAHEDVRYAQFRTEWGKDYERKMFVLLMNQALCGWPLALAVGLAAWCPYPLGLGSTVLAIAIAVVAMGGESLADLQMHNFRTNPANKGKVCDVGLWAWSRHPNYFCEWLYWLTYPALALAGFWPWGVLAFMAPALMFVLLTRVSGVPPLEREMLKSRGDAYRAYQHRVPAFFPRPPSLRPISPPASS